MGSSLIILFFFSVNPVKTHLPQTQRLQNIKDSVRPNSVNYGNTLPAFPNTTDQMYCASYDALSKNFVEKEVLGTGRNDLKPEEKHEDHASDYNVESDNSRQLDSIKMEFHHTPFPVCQSKLQSTTLRSLRSSNESVASHLGQTLIESNTIEQGNAEPVKKSWNKDNVLSGNKEQPKDMQQPLFEVENDHAKRHSDYMEPKPMESICTNRPLSSQERCFLYYYFYYY